MKDKKKTSKRVTPQQTYLRPDFDNSLKMLSWLARNEPAKIKPLFEIIKTFYDNSQRRRTNKGLKV